ncbi:hypothetical protein CHS0354_014462 [Potamilus streckersoni]|uniref:Short-chain collagen C4 n=1 Tax=Potamilus streckersoni TaxID=2493646 RepID=A0AAE0S9M3_9BIVA|nr:hypothetical protein CHS0354_014462 [Potamilus streckersoni]
MFVTRGLFFTLLVISEKFRQVLSTDASHDCPRFDYEYKLLERLLKIELMHKEMEANLMHFQDQLKTIQHLSRGHASTFVRWGKTTCPGNDTELVYEGFAGGSLYSEPGSAADFLCLPKLPTWAKNVGGTDIAAFIYGAEYEIISGSNPFSTVSREDDVPCCVCRPPRTTSLMIPARTDCYPGWNQEYNGYLMSDYHVHPGATNYVCVDANPDAVLGGTANNNGHLMYVVQAKCGSLPCPPYVEGRVIACVVCSK